MIKKAELSKDGKTVTLEVALGEPTTSKSGKTQSLAYVPSGTPTGLKLPDGRPILANLNLYVK